MRIIGGQAKGIRLKTLKNNLTRPTSDRVKESIFNILNQIIVDSKVLDLFSGTGNLGLESISRGAKYAYLVEKNKKASVIIKENIKKTKFDNKITLLIDDVISAIKTLRGKNEKFDIIFMDPPYLKGFIEPTIEAICNNDILAENGVIVVEHDKKDIVKEKINVVIKYREKKYGNTVVSFFSREG